VAQTLFEPAVRARRASRGGRVALGGDPDLLNVLIVVPERMSAWKLYKYLQHLAGNRQKTERYEIALWKKLFYPLATLVMMALALPFAYMHARSGMVGIKVFLGIMLGIFFHMLNSLFSHVGPAEGVAAACRGAVPSILFPPPRS
jgi:lipopolysaccharide export system permease protein